MHPKLTILATLENDLVQSLKSAGQSFTLVEDGDANSLTDALNKTPDGGGLLILSATYPSVSRRIPGELLKEAGKRNVRMLIEYPDEVEGLTFGAPATIIYERVVVADEFLSSSVCGSVGPAKDTITMVNGCYYRPVEAENNHLCLAKVAGYDHIVYGLPQEVHPILFPHPGFDNALICTTSLSCFVRARYAPTAQIEGIWKALLYWLSQENYMLKPAYDTMAAYSADECLPEDCEEKAVNRNIDWFAEHCIYSTGTNMELGVIEGFESAVDCKGSQYMRQVLRSDCLGESAMAIAFGAALQHDPHLGDTATRMTNLMMSSPSFYNDEPTSPMYGLINWFENGKIFYGDDNARVLLGALAVRELLGDDQWDEKILRCAYANIRTSGQKGFRYAALRESSFDEKNWTDYYEEDLTFISPHYTAYLWAVYLWMYALSGREMFLDRARSAITITMEEGIEKWRWQNSLSGEITRMLLPLAFLVRVDDQPKHRAWLQQVVDATLEIQVECGAIRDTFGDLSLGKYPPPQSNERYGTAEASLIQEEGDPATDLLYTLNWAFIGLHEAFLALDDSRIASACDRMAEFLCRIQVKSQQHPKLDGAWMRSFDYEKWEYWGSGADIGWGAWCVETGWVNAWITATMALRMQKRSLLSLEGKANFTKIAPEIEADMFIDRTVRGDRQAASGKVMPGSE